MRRKRVVLMTEAEVIKLMREHLESQFSKVCPHCKRNYPTLRDYILGTERVEPSVSYDAEIEDWNPLKPVGTVTYANCPCGTTLALSSYGMPLQRLWSLYNWARAEKIKRGVTMTELLRYLRDEIRKQVLAAPPDGALA